MFPTEVLEGLDARRDRDGRIAENSARLAFTSSKVTTGSFGEITVVGMQAFDCMFTEEPIFSYGYNTNDENDDALFAGSWPRCYGFVRSYETRPIPNGGLLYVGAYVGLIIDVPGDVALYNLDHYLTWYGVALKDMSPDVMDRLPVAPQYTPPGG